MRCHTKSVTIFATPTQRKKRQSSPSTNVVCVVYSCDQQKKKFTLFSFEKRNLRVFLFVNLPIFFYIFIVIVLFIYFY